MENSIQDEFISTVSHELRTPLTSIRGFSQTLLNSWDKIDEENKKKFIGIIEEQSERLINLVENILAASKIDRDKFVYKSVNVVSLTEKVIQLISIKYPDRIIEKSYPKTEVSARLDEDKFQQIMTNLLDNAGKYSFKGAKISISAAVKEEFAEIRIRNEGEGIKKEDIPKLFNKFVRLENHLTSKTQGNGLGLYITKHLTEAMGGNITAESEYKKWAEFTVRFPVYNHEEALKCSLQS